MYVGTCVLINFIMQKIGDTANFKARQNIVLRGFDPVSAGGFTQVPNFILKDGELSSNAKLAYTLLLSYAWNNNRVFPGQDRMAEEFGTSRPTVTKAITELTKAGYLDVQRRGQGKTNIYTLYHTVKTKS